MILSFFWLTGSILSSTSYQTQVAVFNIILGANRTLFGGPLRPCAAGGQTGKGKGKYLKDYLKSETKVLTYKKWKVNLPVTCEQITLIGKYDNNVTIRLQTFTV